MKRNLNLWIFLFFILHFSFFIFLSPAQSMAQELRTATYPDGTIRYKGYFVDGKPSGEMTRFYPDGRVKAKMNYKGDTVNAVLYSRTGEFTTSGKYVSRKKNGCWEYRKDDRLIGVEEFRNDSLHGSARRYNASGIIIEQKSWADGKSEGEWKVYYEDGKPKIQAVFAGGELEGILKSYDRGGKLRTEGRYQNNRKEGEWVFYDEAGNLLKKQIYHAGLPENAGEQELEESRKLDALINSDKKIADPAVFADDPEAYMRMTGME